MKTVFHQASTRGHANHGWLNSYQTFSFAGYQDPSRVHFGALRVLNDDIVKGGNGFGQHPHDNMEIISIPLKGELEHGDNTGGHRTIRPGEVQIMSAGSGITHSEKNASKIEDVNFLQIWVFPKVENITPRYDQKLFSVDDKRNRFLNVVSPDRDSASLWINQEAWFSLGKLDPDYNGNYKLHDAANGVYAFVIDGEVTVNGHRMSRRDGLGIWETDTISVMAATDAEILLIEVPMY